MQQCHSCSKEKFSIESTALKASRGDGWINHIRNVKIHNEQEPSDLYEKMNLQLIHSSFRTHLNSALVLSASLRFSLLVPLRFLSDVSHTLSNPLLGSNDFSSQHSVTQTVTYLNIKPPILGTGLWRQTANLAAPHGRCWSWN